MRVLSREVNPFVTGIDLGTETLNPGSTFAAALMEISLCDFTNVNDFCDVAIALPNFSLNLDAGILFIFRMIFWICLGAALSAVLPLAVLCIG